MERKKGEVSKEGKIKRIQKNIKKNDKIAKEKIDDAQDKIDDANEKIDELINKSVTKTVSDNNK